MPPDDLSSRRSPLTRERVLRAAVEVADANGVSGLTIRSLATALDAKPMTLYHYVPNKDAILDGVVDLVFSEIDLPDLNGDWRVELRGRSESMRMVLRRHPWAIGLMGSRRAPGPATLAHHDTMIGLFQTAGFSLADTAHAFAFVDAYVYGFALQESSLPFETTTEVHELASEVLSAMPVDRYPYFVAFATQHVMQPDYNFADEFNVGLDIVIEAIARFPTAPRRKSRRSTYHRA